VLQALVNQGLIEKRGRARQTVDVAPGRVSGPMLAIHSLLASAFLTQTKKTECRYENKNQSTGRYLNPN
jgi:hypothetical protein